MELFGRNFASEMELEQFEKEVLANIRDDIADAEDYQNSVIEPSVKERYQIYYSDKDYYRKLFPKLSKVSTLVSTDVADTIEWALPSLMKVFAGGDEVITITGVSEEDERNAEVMQELLGYQLQRQNKFFPILYNWMKDALITGMGIVKCYWDRAEAFKEEVVIINQRALDAMLESGVEIINIQPPDAFGDMQVTYKSPYYLRNSPKIENILVSEFLYSSDAKNLEEANFVAHKKKVTMSYLRERQRDGIYSNVDDIRSENGKTWETSQVEEAIGDGYHTGYKSKEKARDEVTIYECYTKIDIDGDGVLEDMIVTVCDDVILRIEHNYMGRHPFFAISPTKDPHRIWVKRSYAELIGELQHLKVALTRQIVQNIALTNDPKMVLAEDAINIDDYVEGRAVIRKKADHPMHDVAMSMPVNQLSPWTFQFLEYIEGQKENRTGITRYNQGLDASSLNKTATGISQILGQSAQRLELIARMFAETGIYELFRFMVSLNQKFIDQNTVIRLTNKDLHISPDDLNGNFDLVVNAGITIATKESTQMTLQTMLTALMQVNATGMTICTPDNIFNLFKKWFESAGFKNYTDYITEPSMIQQKMMMELALKQQVLASLPPQAVQFYAMYGTLPPEILLGLPPELQALFGGSYDYNQGQTTGNGGFSGPGGASGANPIPSAGMAGQLPRQDNRVPQNVPREGNGPVAEPSTGVGSF